MPNNLNRVKQQTGSYCGPAVFEMLVSALGEKLDQEAMVDACDVRKTIMKEGVDLGRLALGLRKILPGLTTWVKCETSIKDLKTLLDAGYLVGVDWQGIFNSDEYGDEFWNRGDKVAQWWSRKRGEPQTIGDQGHYCVVLKVNEKEGYIKFADPYGHYAGKDRFVAIWEFEERWWDDRIGRDEQGKKVRVVENRQMFLITTNEDEFPASVGMARVELT